MPIEKRSPGHSVIDVLDRVLDKGLVIDAWVRVSIAGIELVGVEARVIVASITTYVKYSATVAGTPVAARPVAARPVAARPVAARPVGARPVPAGAMSAPSVAVAPQPGALRMRARRRRRRVARRRALVNARCERGCTFAVRRDAIGSTMTCPFDASRICTLSAAPAA